MFVLSCEMCLRPEDVLPAALKIKMNSLINTLFLHKNKHLPLFFPNENSWIRMPYRQQNKSRKQGSFHWEIKAGLPLT
jgi:hypothetical protein